MEDKYLESKVEFRARMHYRKQKAEKKARARRITDERD